MACDPLTPDGRIANIIEAAKPELSRAESGRGRGRPPHADQATREKIRHRFKDLMELGDLARVMTRRPDAEKWRKLNAEFSEKLKHHKPALTEDDLVGLDAEPHYDNEGMAQEELDHGEARRLRWKNVDEKRARRWAKLRPKDAQGFEKRAKRLADRAEAREEKAKELAAKAKARGEEKAEPPKPPRARGFRAIVIRQLSEEFDLSTNLIRHIVESSD
jgi:hypothetical protein